MDALQLLHLTLLFTLFPQFIELLPLSLGFLLLHPYFLLVFLQARMP